MSALLITVFQYEDNLDVSCDICISVWGHTRWLPGDVYTVWLCDSLLLGLPSRCPLCPVKQCGRNQEWCLQAVHDVPETIWQDCRKHRHLAGMETTLQHYSPHTLTLSTHSCPLQSPHSSFALSFLTLPTHTCSLPPHSLTPDSLTPHSLPYTHPSCPSLTFWHLTLHPHTLHPHIFSPLTPSALSLSSCAPTSLTQSSLAHALHSHSPLVLIPHIFSSPELKAQVSFSDHLSSVICLSVCLHVRPSVCKLFTFSSSSPESLGQFQPNLAQSILGWRGFKFLQMKNQ